MSDFFSFEFLDDEAPDVYNGGNSELNVVAARKNQSLSAKSTAYLQEAMGRLVPSSFVYGESGLGNRAYELFVLCSMHAFNSGKRSSYLMAAICVMHASYELRSDLVIIPSDIIARYKDMDLHQIRYHSILRMYDMMCESLNLSRLNVSMEKLLGRIFRESCHLDRESLVSEYTQTALKIIGELKSVLPIDAPVGKIKKRSLYITKSRVETIAGCAAVLTCRLHGYKDVTAKHIAEELNISRGSLNYLINTYVKTAMKKDTTDLIPVGESKCQRVSSRVEPLHIGDMVIPTGVVMGVRDRRKKQRNEEVYSLAIAKSNGEKKDSLDFLFSEDEHVGAMLCDVPADDGPVVSPKERDVSNNQESTLERSHQLIINPEQSQTVDTVAKSSAILVPQAATIPTTSIDSIVSDFSDLLD